MRTTAPTRKKTQPRSEPRMLGGGVWYYVNRRSVDVYAEIATAQGIVVRNVRLQARVLEAMLGELK